MGGVNASVHAGLSIGVVRVNVCVCVCECRLVNHPCRLMLLDVEKQLGVSYN